MWRQAEQVKKRRSIEEVHRETEASGHNLGPTPARQNQKSTHFAKLSAWLPQVNG